jgi:ELWxxDGT repeat protein
MLVTSGGLLYFNGFDATHGNELWRSDGTAAGTAMVLDIRPGTGNSLPGQMVDVDGTLLFVADDGVSGVEPWRSDGTAAGTRRLADVWPGPTGSRATSLTPVGSLLFFNANDGVSGAEVWRSDGTPEGTLRLTDIQPGEAGSNPRGFTAYRGSVFFAAGNDQLGRELWRVPLHDCDPGDPDARECDDRDPCTFDACDPLAGCTHRTPLPSCLDAARSTLVLQRRGFVGDSLSWVWNHGASIGMAELGDPKTTTGYAFCVYAGPDATPFTHAVVPPGARWKSGRSHHQYKDLEAMHDGIRDLRLKASDRDRSLASLRGRGARLLHPVLGDLPLPIVAQLVNRESGTCMQSVFGPGDVTRNDTRDLKARVR